MTHEQLDLLIDSVNDGTAVDRIFHWPLAGNVREARVWFDYPTGRCWTERGDKFFFIYVESACVAAILDMGQNDIHAYVKEAHQGRGVMSEAFRSVVFPYWRRRGRTEQRTQYITEQARRSLERLGARFEVNEQGRKIAIIALDQFAGIVVPPPARPTLSVERMTSIRERFNAVYGLIVRAQSKCSTFLAGEKIVTVNTRFEHLVESFHFIEEFAVGDDSDLLRGLGYEFDGDGNAFNTFEENEYASNDAATRIEIPQDPAEAYEALLCKAYGLLQMVKEEALGSTGEDGDNGFYGIVDSAQWMLSCLSNH